MEFMGQEHHPMRISLFSWLSLIPFFLILFAGMYDGSVSGQCLDDQRSLLLQLKDDLTFEAAFSTRLVNWNPTEDCCDWDGVGCDTSGRVISLELDGESIYGGIEKATSLFGLQFLQKLNLASNRFVDMPIPSGIANLTNLVHLNLSRSGFVGQIPTELSNLRNLVTLDLSIFLPEIPLLKLENPNLKTLVQNLSALEELYLDGVDISFQGSNWCQALASSVPRLTVLSLPFCHISSPIDASLSKLRALSIIRLDRNNLSSTVPDYFGNFPNLRTLSFGSCNLLGIFPGKIFLLPTLQFLDLSNNKLLQGNLQQFPHNGSLREIVLRGTSFSGSLPASISNLPNLRRIDFSNCRFSGPIPLAIANLSKLANVDLSSNNFSGPIPLAIANLPELVSVVFSNNSFTGQIPSFRKSKNLVNVDFSYNNFSGPVPSFQKSKNLTSMFLSHNNLTGSLSPAHFRGLSNLEFVDLGSNLLHGSIPSSLFALPSLKILLLANNQLSGLMNDEFSIDSSISQLEVLDLTANHFNGSIPKFFFELKMLSQLSLSSNFFTGNFQLEIIKNLPNLTIFELSYNNISVDRHMSNSSSSTWPQLSTLELASCKLKVFPTELANQLELYNLDLSNNQIEGEIPNWIWDVGGGELSYLNLSSNLLVGLQEPYQIPIISVLDLHSNQLQGKIPNFLPSDFDETFPVFFSVSNNRLTGSIPESVCTAFELQVLDFSNNSLTGRIPSCLMENAYNLAILNLAGNNLTGNIPDTFPLTCSLKTLDLNSNALEGKIPRSLINCTSLEVLNIGNNRLEDTFPCRLNSSNLRVLVLRSNKLHGDVLCPPHANNSWPELQIVDVAFNNFSGVLFPEYLSSLRKMMFDNDNAQLPGDHLHYGFSTYPYSNYQDKVTVIVKGQEIRLVKILTIFTSIDFSSNAFLGEIPKNIGDLRFLYILNLSHNAFTGRIPSSIGNIRNLESLDLSTNQLTGEIPATLASLTFLSFLNLSVNNLSGMIPRGPQFQTFTATSYQENPGLCGFPVDAMCNGSNVNNSSPGFGNMASQPKTEIKWEYVIAAAGFVTGLGGFTLLLLIWERWRTKYFHYVDQFLSIFIDQKKGGSIAEHIFRNQAIRRL